MSQQRTPANIYEDGKDTGVSTARLAWVLDGSVVRLTEGRRGTHQVVWDQATGVWRLEAIS